MEKYSHRIKPEEFKEWNEKMVEKYDPDAFHHHPNSLIRFIEARRVKTILRFLDLKEGDRLLEVGCGAGNILEMTPPSQRFGVDLSTFVLEKAKQRLNKTAQLFQANAQSLPLKSGVFQRVICSEVLEHLLDPAAALQEIGRILDSHGAAILSVPNEPLINRIKRILVGLGIFNRLFQKQGDYARVPERMDDEWHLHSLDLREWLNLVKPFFRVTRIRRIPFFWIPVRYVIRVERM